MLQNLSPVKKGVLSLHKQAEAKGRLVSTIGFVSTACRREHSWEHFKKKTDSTQLNSYKVWMFSKFMGNVAISTCHHWSSFRRREFKIQKDQNNKTHFSHSQSTTTHLGFNHSWLFQGLCSQCFAIQSQQHGSVWEGTFGQALQITHHNPSQKYNNTQSGLTSTCVPLFQLTNI